MKPLSKLVFLLSEPDYDRSKFLKNRVQYLRHIFPGALAIRGRSSEVDYGQTSYTLTAAKITTALGYTAANAANLEWIKLTTIKQAVTGTTMTASALTKYDVYRLTIIVALDTINSNMSLTINNDTGTNYSAATLSFLSTTVASSSTSSDSKVQIFSTGDNSANDLIIITAIIYNRNIALNFHMGQIMSSVERAGVISSAIHSYRTDFKHSQSADISRFDLIATVGNILQNSLITIEGANLN